MYTVSMYPCMWYMSLHCHCPPNEWSSSTMPTMHLQEEVGHYETYRENHLMLWLFMFSSRQNHVKRPSQWKKRNCTWKKRPSFQRLRFRSFRGKIKAPVDSGSVASRLELVKMKLSWYEFSNTAGVGSIKHMNCFVCLFFPTFLKVCSILRELQQSSPRLEQHLFNVDLVHRLKGRWRYPEMIKVTCTLPWRVIKTRERLEGFNIEEAQEWTQRSCLRNWWSCPQVEHTLNLAVNLQW